MNPMHRFVRRLVLVSALLLLAACATRSTDEVSDDTVEILPDNQQDADYLVLFLNRQSFLYNGDLASDRQNVTAARLKEIGCRRPRLVREKAERQDGTWAFGRPRIVYYSEWSCG